MQNLGIREFRNLGIKNSSPPQADQFLNPSISHNETFAKLSLFVISTEERNLNGLESLRFLVVNTPRNDKIQRSHNIIIFEKSV